MSLSKGDIRNFETLKRCVKYGDLALIETTIRATGEKVAMLAACVVGNDGLVQITPFGNLAPANPYEFYADPTEDRANG